MKKKRNSRHFGPKGGGVPPALNLLRVIELHKTIERSDTSISSETKKGIFCHSHVQNDISMSIAKSFSF